MARDAQRKQMVADLTALGETYGGVSREMLERAATGRLTMEEVADYEEQWGLVPGLVLITSAYVDPSFISDGRIALARDPALDPTQRQMALQTYDIWSRLN